MEINHFSHRHPLRPVRVKPFVCYRTCDACLGKFYGGELYECEPCIYRLHKRCLATEAGHKFLSPYHPHILYAETRQGIEVECNACCRQIPHSFFYRCQHCNLNLDVICAFLKRTEENFHHFNHCHPLELYENTLDDDSECSLCYRLCEGPTYACRNCNFCLHQHCSMLELPQEIQHPSHQCFLTLRTRKSYNFHKRFTSISLDLYFDNALSLVLHYSCENCKFASQFNPALEFIRLEGQKQFYHFSHRHPLELTEPNNEDGQVNCSACGNSCSTRTYGCNLCQYFLHQSCVDLPLEIRHFFHPCPLTLRIQPKSFSCGACDKTIQGFYFYCEWCTFSMDIECALLPTIKSQSDKEQFCHLSHGHPLTLAEIKEDDHSYCSVCRRCCSGEAFVCRKCSFFLDKSCFELPQEIQHAFHPSHPLILQAKPSKFKSVCNVCCKHLSGLTYRCELCDFEMHIECNLAMPTVSYKGHDHHLLFLENIETEVKCNSCETTCDSCVFHCAECDFSLHLMCGPLPCTIPPECHYHPFILMDSPLEDESDEFYCDVCEKERDPRLPVYYCKECFYPAEIKCVMSEVVFTLKGCYGEVELRTPDGQLSGKVISKSLEVIELNPKEELNGNKKAAEMEMKPVLTLEDLDDILSSFNGDENTELKCVLEASRRDIIVAGETSSSEHSKESEVTLFSCSDLIIAFSGDENMEMNVVLAAPGRKMIEGKEISSNDQREYSESNLKLSMFADEAYERFMKKLDSNSLTLWKRNEEVFNIGDELITLKLSGILEKLCAKYGDVSAESTLSPRVKNYFIVMLCGTMHSMCTTRINEISPNLLLNWWNNLKILKFAGFKVQFAFDRLEKVTLVYFGLQVEKSEAELDIKITNLSATIEKLSIECKALKEKRERIALTKTLKSSKIKDCLTEVLTKKWQLVGTGLL